ncbi:hypothetical protein XAR_3390 [Xanthomonas citri pv. glycines str. 8ra]|nr:hypothetical protein XAR_3390 [Xanthomonas citri pv. glycines str. 8ra]
MTVHAARCARAWACCTPTPTPTPTRCAACVELFERQQGASTGGCVYHLTSRRSPLRQWRCMPTGR